MKTLQNLRAESLKMITIQQKIGKEVLTKEDIDFLMHLVEEKIPGAYFILGKYELVQNGNETETKKWFDLYYQEANGYGLFEAANFLINYDDYKDYAISFMKRAAWKKHIDAIRIIKFMNENPFEVK